MKNLVRASVFAFVAAGLGGSIVGCEAHAQVNAPPPPHAEVVVNTPPPPPPPKVEVVVAQPPPPPPAQAAPPPPPPQAHPAYLHALSDLRNARFNLERKGGDRAMKWDEKDAILEIDRAIAEIKQASIDDGKDLNDHPAVDAKEQRSGRLHKAIEALRQARKDINEREDNAYAQGLKARALKHIDEAIHFSEMGIQAASQMQ